MRGVVLGLVLAIVAVWANGGNEHENCAQDGSKFDQENGSKFDPKQNLDELHITVNAHSVAASIIDPQKGSVLDWEMGLDLPSNLQNPSQCHTGSICYEWGDLARLEVNRNDLCYEVNWEVKSLTSATDCFDLGEGFWYSGNEEKFQHFPMDKSDNMRAMVPLVPGDMLQNKDEFFGGVVEPYWLSSRGVGITVPQGVPLFYSWNDGSSGKMCLSAKDKPPYRLPEPKTVKLKYNVCKGSHMREVDDHVRSKFIARPSEVPDLRMFEKPIWSTWAMYKADINSSVVMDFASFIRANGFEDAQLEIDDNWETCYGDALFDTSASKFPDPKKMVDVLKAMGFRVTLWVHPFINVQCSSWSQGAYAPFEYFVRDVKTQTVTGLGVTLSEHVTGLTYWWQGRAASYLDFTNSRAVEWWAGRLKKLQTEIGIDNFKFDAGEINWMPTAYLLDKDEPKETWPTVYSTRYAEAVHEHFGKGLEVRVGYRAQHVPIFVRMLDKDSNWNYDNGLKTLVTTLLQMGFAGYPFVLPDMIGGNGYGNDPLNESEIPEKELYVRWLQANVFMPSLQFSFVPWLYDGSVTQYARDMAELHKRYGPRILELAQESTETGAPINRPLWWIAPEDETAQSIDSEFLLGNDLLVAPVLDKGATSRDIYLPAGTWKDEANPGNPEITGPIWLRDYPADLFTLPYFTLV